MANQYPVATTYIKVPLKPEFYAEKDSGLRVHHHRLHQVVIHCPIFISGRSFIASKQYLFTQHLRAGQGTQVSQSTPTLAASHH